MKNQNWKTLFLILLIGLIPLRAEQKSIGTKKYTLSFCAVFKNGEEAYLKEWIEYHRSVGVDHFYLYNNSSIDRCWEVLGPYIKQKVVTLIHWPDWLGSSTTQHPSLWAFSTQIPAYENAVRLRAAQTRWMMFIDIGEFVVPHEANTIAEILEKYEEIPGVILPVVYFDVSGAPLHNLAIAAAEVAEQEREKTIFKPEYYNGSTFAPCRCLLKDKQKAIALNPSEAHVHRYRNLSAR